MRQEVAVSRIEPLSPPFESEVADALAAMMPAGVPPIALFRTFAVNLPMTWAMQGWGGYELSKRLSLSMRQRELVINRVTARCGCEYEWGVHIAFFASRVGLTPAQITSLTHGDIADPCWNDPAERALLAVVDALHDSADVDDATWALAAEHLDQAQLLDVCLLAGWYHAISFAANAARVPLEDGAPRFADVT
jgi:alkylhydroperoxidase family enzyme